MNKENVITSIYDLFDYCRKNKVSRRGTCVITCKQYVFYGDIYSNFRNHFDISYEIDKRIVPYISEDDILCGFSENAYAFAEPNYVMVVLPESHELSLPQASLICKFLDDLKRYNDEVPEKEKNSIKMVSRTAKGISDTTDVEAVQEYILNSVNKKMTIKKEDIIGKTLSEDETVETLSKQIEFSQSDKLSKQIEEDDYFGKYANKISNTQIKFRK